MYKKVVEFSFTQQNIFRVLVFSIRIYYFAYATDRSFVYWKVWKPFRAVLTWRVLRCLRIIVTYFLVYC